MGLHPADTFVPKTLSPCLGSHIPVHQDGQLADGYFIRVKPLFKAYSLLYVGHGSSCRRSRSISWPSAQREVTSESRHITARRENYVCLRTMQANDGDCQDQPGGIPASGRAVRYQFTSAGKDWLHCQLSPGSLGTKGLPELFMWFNR